MDRDTDVLSSVPALSRSRVPKAELNVITISQDVIEIAKAFFQMLIDIVTMALDEKSLKGA